MLELLLSTPGHLLNRALFSAAREAAIRQGQPHGLLLSQDVRMSAPGGVQASSSREFSERSKRAWSPAGSRLCARPPPLWPCQAESLGGHKVLGAGGGQLSTVRSPAYRQRPGCFPLPALKPIKTQVPVIATSHTPYPGHGVHLSIQWVAS